MQIIVFADLRQREYLKDLGTTSQTIVSQNVVSVHGTTVLEPTISAQTEICKIGLQGFALGAQAAFGNSTLPAQTLLALGGKIKTWASHKLKTTVACVCVQGLGLQGLLQAACASAWQALLAK